jgi:opacity protein-like surface antigen
VKLFKFLILLSVFISNCLVALPALNMGLTLGYGFSMKSQPGQDIAVSTALTNRYGAATTKSGLHLLGLTLGYLLTPIPKLTQLQSIIGVGLYQSTMKYHGTEIPAINYGGGDSLNYSYDDKSTALVLESKWLYNLKGWQPYVLIGLGLSNNRLANYSEVPTNPAGTAAPIAPYNDHSSQSFAYELALGVQKKIDQHFQLSADLRDLSYGDEFLTAPKGQYYNGNAKFKADALALYGIAINASYQF